MSRARLLSVSARLFARGGFEATSMRDIAARAGMLAGSMYYHFPSKNDLIAAVYEAGVAEIGGAVDEAVGAARGPWPRLEAACAAHLDALLANSAHAAVMTADLRRLDSRLKRRLVTLRDGYEKRFVELVAALPLPAGTDRSLWRLQLLGALNWTPTWYRPGGSKGPPEIARALIAALRSPSRLPPGAWRGEAATTARTAACPSKA